MDSPARDRAPTGGGYAGIELMREEDKATKSEVNYGPAGKHPDRCGVCRHFIPPPRAELGRCQIVQGVIISTDWCKLFERQRKAA